MTTDLQTLFARDPLSLSQQDLETIVRELRERRKQYNLGNQSAGKAKPVSAKAEAARKVTGQLDIKELL